MALFQNILNPSPPPEIKSREGPLFFHPTSPTYTQLPNVSSFTPSPPSPSPPKKLPNLSSFTPPPPPPTHTQLPNLPSAHVIKNIVVFTCLCVRESMTKGDMIRGGNSLKPHNGPSLALEPCSWN